MSKITFGKEIDMIALASPIQGSTVIAYHSGGGGFAKGALLQKNSSGVLSYVGGVELSGVELSGKEDVANKQNSLAIDGTGTKYYTVDYINTLDSNLLHKTGNETISGAKDFNQRLMVTREITDLNYHAYDDITTINTLTNDPIGGYASYDTYVNNISDYNVNHMHGYQSRLRNNGTGLLEHSNGFSYEFINNGTITNQIGVAIASPTGTGTITNKKGLYIGNYSGSNSYSIYSDNGDNYFGGQIQTSKIIPLNLSQYKIPIYDGISNGLIDSALQIYQGRLSVNKLWTAGNNVIDAKGISGSNDVVFRGETNPDSNYNFELYANYDNTNKAGLRSTTGNIIKQNLSGDVTIGNGTIVEKSTGAELTDTPTAPTATVGTNTTQIATTAFVLANAGALPSHLEYNNTDKTIWNNGGGDVASNTSFGEFSLTSNTTGSYNNAMGINALNRNTDGSYNNAVGTSALEYLSSGSLNSAFGGWAGRSTSTGADITVADNSVFLGYDTRPLADNETNQIVIGSEAIGNGSNTVTLGNDDIVKTVLKGVVTAPLTTNALIDADATGKALATKEYVLANTGGATLASELTVTPAVNGLSNAQAVLTDHETRIDTLETSSSGTTNLTTTQSSTTVTVNSDTGTDATIVLANGTNAGVSTNDYTTAEKSKLTGIATGATVNSSDATLLDRANHTGTQTASTISDFNTSVDSRIASSSPDLSFLNVAYASTITRAYDNLRPNLEIDITGNLDFTLTDTSSGESGLLNLYFSGSETATLQGVTDLVVTGAGAMIPVYFVHDSDGIKWYKDEVGGATVDTSLFALKNGTILYHTLPRFTPTGTISTVGVNITISTGQFTSTMVGQKLTINGEERIIATYISATSVTVDTAYGTNYVSVSSANWDVYNKAVEVDSIGGIQIRSNVNTSILDALSNSNMTVGNSVVGSGAGWELKSAGIVLKSTGVLVHSSTGFQTGTPDVGLRRNSPKVYEVYDGVTNTGLEANRGDLLVRNLISKSNVYADDATADADTSLPSGAFYKITGSRVIYQKP